METVNLELIKRKVLSQCNQNESYNEDILQLCSTLQADDISTNFKTTKQADKNAQKVNFLPVVLCRVLGHANQTCRVIGIGATAEKTSFSCVFKMLFYNGY